MRDNKETIDAINQIIKINSSICNFWTDVEGFAPLNAARLLNKSRLDRQVSLSYCLKIWLEKVEENAEEGSLILAWTNLGSLIEGTMKLFLTVWYETYKIDIDAIKKKGKIIDPDVLPFELLIQYFRKRIWKILKKEELEDFVRHIQSRRNAIHSYKDREIGTFEEFFSYVQKYLELLILINNKLPHPFP